MSLLEHAEEIYQWLKKGDQPYRLDEGDYSIHIEDGNLCILKKSSRACFTPNLDDLWDDLHQDAAEQPAPEVMQFGTNQTTQPLKAKLTIPKTEWDRLKGLAQDAYPSAINSKPVSVGDLPVVTFDATLTKIEDAAESPAEQPSKRVPQIGDVIVWYGDEYLVYLTFDNSENFRAIKINCRALSATTFFFERHMEGQEGGWTFKE